MVFWLCDTAIYSRKYIWSLFLAESSKWLEDKGVFCYVRDVTFQKYLRVGAGWQSNPMLEGWNLSPAPLTSGEEGAVGGWIGHHWPMI